MSLMLTVKGREGIVLAADSRYSLIASLSKDPIEQHPGAFGITYGGQRDFIDRILLGYDSLLRPEADARKAVLTTLPLATMPLADCFELAVYLIRTTARSIS